MDIHVRRKALNARRSDNYCELTFVRRRDAFWLISDMNFQGTLDTDMTPQKVHHAIGDVGSGICRGTGTAVGDIG